MEDREILDLYWKRNEQAIRETDRAYGTKLQGLACRIVENRQDSEECVSDTYMAAWDHIPPQKPNYFFAWLAKVCRNFAMGILDRRHAAKRSAEMVTLTAEMELCIPDSRREAELEGEEIGRILNEFLAGLSKESRILFLRRYWYAESIAEIAGRYSMGESKVKTSLHRSRNKLRQHLEKEGIHL